MNHLADKPRPQLITLSHALLAKKATPINVIICGSRGTTRKKRNRSLSLSLFIDFSGIIMRRRKDGERDNGPTETGKELVVFDRP